ncbi:hypothetical protein [Mobilicoccus pelagius]|uniref:Uncharacterized protein n=1 Tax=Mobilicoccus pelagius NBRC 104925 TaxID=1089455 RepID=H5UUD3_9MICO|nr:hypothetical protein [Mobilicoccus pelagius]GAB49341.1 hypothetical protein MOPEL_113_00210 [Mobilicoccus pelagius NBRC 104925]
MRRWVRRDRTPRDTTAAGALDAALNLLVRTCRLERRALPVCPVATVTDDRVTLHLAAPSGHAPASWEDDDATTWWCARTALPEGASGARALADSLDSTGSLGSAAYPGFVLVGHAPDGAATFVDLGAAPGLVTVEGVAGEAAAVVAGLGGDLALMPWARDVRVWTASDLDGPTGTVPDVLRTPPPSLGGLDGRWGAPPRGRHDVVLLTSPATPRLRSRVRAAARRRGAPTVVAPVAPGDEAARGVWRWRVADGVVTW